MKTAEVRKEKISLENVFDFLKRDKAKSYKSPPGPEKERKSLFKRIFRKKRV